MGPGMSQDRGGRNLARVSRSPLGKSKSGHLKVAPALYMEVENPIPLMEIESYFSYLFYYAVLVVKSQLFIYFFVCSFVLSLKFFI